MTLFVPGAPEGFVTKRQHSLTGVLSAKAGFAYSGKDTVLSIWNVPATAGTPVSG